MPATPRIVKECPSVENTVLVDSYQSQYPARYSLEDNDKHVLHAGGEDYGISVDFSRVNFMDANAQLVLESPVALFVLNSTFVIWAKSKNLGLEIPYTLIALHAIKDVEGVPVLYLQLIPCLLFTTSGDSEYVETLDLLIREGNGTEHGAYETHAEVATKHKSAQSFLLKNYSIEEIYDALSTCSALHFDSENESDGYESPSSWITKDTGSQLEIPAHWVNSGDADDLGMDAELEEDGEAGMNIDVGETPAIGVRRRNSDALCSAEFSKARRVV